MSHTSYLIHPKSMVGAYSIACTYQVHTKPALLLLFAFFLLTFFLIFFLLNSLLFNSLLCFCLSAHKIIVSTVDLECKLNLPQIALPARNAEYNPRINHCYQLLICRHFVLAPKVLISAFVYSF